MAKEKQDITGSNCLKDLTGKLIISERKIKRYMWKQYMAKLDEWCMCTELYVTWK